MSKLRKLLGLGRMLVKAMVFLVLAIPLHEYAHIQMLHLLGGNGYVKYTFISGFTKVTVVPSYEHWYILTALAGGGAVVLVYYVLNWLIHEADTSIILRLLIVQQIPYAIMEGLGLVYTPICVATIGTGTVIMLKRLIKNGNN